MHPARTLLATAAATAALLLGAPAAYATAPNNDHEDSSHSKDHDSNQDYGHDSEDSWNGTKHEKKDEEDWNGKHDENTWKDDHDENSWKGDHDKPKGGMHTGGGALATPTVTAGGLAVLAVAGTGLYAARRRKNSTTLA
ncbi:hypothetical protein OHT76_41675 [Streptomyces sp. NBC_00287]|uniref:hypothetical protein n=1 Tax=Streptomyces sp. NBC_00287 TaxID=2975702 RepID=UPI002E2BB356|nr:hypothetical protein [Streptomyces sp. NBC_00287]